MIEITGNTAVLHAPDEIVVRCMSFFSIRDPNWAYIKNQKWDGYHRFVTRRGTFSTGLVPVILSHLKNNGMEEYAKVKDSRTKPAHGGYHIELAHDLWDEQKALVAGFKKNTLGWGCWHSATNSGKTESAMQLIADLGVDTLFVVPTLALLEQTRNRFQAAFPKERIGVLGDCEEDIQPITIACAATLGMYAGQLERGTKASRITSYLRRVQFLVVDEADVAAKKSGGRRNRYTSFASYCGAYYRLGMSGTISEHDVLKRYRISELFGPIVGSITNKMQVEKGRSSKGHIISIPSGCHGDATSLVFNKKRNQLIADIAAQAANLGKKGVLFTRRVDQGRAIANALRLQHIPTRCISGQTPKGVREEVLKAMNSNLYDILVANIIIDRGVNTPAFTLGIDCNPTFDAARLNQQVGRTLRKKEDDNLFFFVLLDDGSSAHSSRLKALENEDCYTFHTASSPQEVGELMQRILEDERRSANRLQQQSHVSENY